MLRSGLHACMALAAGKVWSAGPLAKQEKTLYNSEDASFGRAGAEVGLSEFLQAQQAQQAASGAQRRRWQGDG